MKEPNCFGQFSKCPLRKKFTCGWHDPTLPRKCHLEEIKQKRKRQYGVGWYVDEEGVLWVCG